ncbi:ribulokinase [Clostridium sp. AM58-1XD]|uniref:ribulokinase n=1 Tax=Clostridium sp. AM58-1XD TaxID=2292307 RepID=UPI0015F3792A|nr:ribulokinase [Clostridium sp. AM58-1XD]
MRQPIQQVQAASIRYIEGFEEAVRKAVAEGSKKVGRPIGEKIAGIGVDTTGSTPCPVNKEGIPLALLPEFADNPNAMFWLWKDHTAIDEAKEINRILSDFRGENYTRFQGEYASEWWWAKILHCARTDSRVKEAAYSWIEHCDWIPALLTGRTKPEEMYRCSCAAGHKALWHSDFGGLPAHECLKAIDPYLEKVAETYGQGPQVSTTNTGMITPEWAERLGISKKCIIGGSSLDAHAGAVGAGITDNTLVMVIGTSAVDMLIEKRQNVRGKDLKDSCGMAENSIVPGYIGIESSQAAFGDVYSWIRDILMWSVRDFVDSMEGISEEQKRQYTKDYKNRLLDRLSQEAMAYEGEDISAVDWLNGRRYPIINEKVKSGVYGLSLSTDTVQLFRSFVLSTVFGARRIVESFVTRGIQIDRIITVGGVSKRSPLIMQLLADALKRPIQVSNCNQACARGAAIYAAVAAGFYHTIVEAQKTMCIGFSNVYTPNEDNFTRYDILYRKYLNVGRHFEDIQSSWDGEGAEKEYEQ